MAYITGEATNHLDLLTVLRDFLTTNVDLVAASQQWEVVGGKSAGAIVAGDFASFKGPGLGGTDQIYMSVEAYTNAPAGIFSLRMSGHTAYNEASPTSVPPGLNSPWVYLPLINATIRYWIVANGRRFIMVAKVNNRYDVMYGGFILSEHLPSDWSYPVLIGGSANSYMQSSVDASSHANFWRGYQSGYLFTPAQIWRLMYNYSQNVPESEASSSSVDLLTSITWRNNLGVSAYARTIDGEPWLRTGQIAEVATDDLAPKNILGDYDGLFFTPSAGAVIEGIITHDSKDYLVLANVYRSSDGQVAALLLE